VLINSTSVLVLLARSNSAKLPDEKAPIGAFFISKNNYLFSYLFKSLQ
jgi:hypothetical protein